MSGKLNWLSEITRPDISLNCFDMASHTRDANIGTIKELNKIVRKKTIKFMEKFDTEGLGNIRI